MKQKVVKARTPRAVLASALVLMLLSLVSCATAPETAYQKPEMRAAVMGPPAPSQLSAPLPLLEKGEPVDWWFVFKFNGATFPGCGDSAQRSCLFGGTVQDYQGQFSQQFVYASSANASLQKGTGCVGDTLQDPVGATFDQIYNGSYYYVIWNDQFYDDPPIAGCSGSCSSPWGHAKGMLAWNDDGEGVVMQVSTPSWPASGSSAFPRKDGNTLGCVQDNDVKVSQHFFALRLNKDDLVQILKALQNASVVTDPANRQIVSNGGPSDVQDLVKQLGKQSSATTRMTVQLSSGVELVSKPSALPVPPWQMVSATLNGVPLRTATWWAAPKIATTTETTAIGCWDGALGTPGPVQIATTGAWDGTPIGLTGGLQPDSNHAKIGVSLDPGQPYAIFGDLNQQGTLSGNCKSSQNGRGGTFYILDNKALADSLTGLIKGDTAAAAQ
ncbi:MAG TPA: deoxyribonuclease II family protein [Syntrophorhabdales bacterium]|nr:deoxyribonuclease II family protein [Syntrophorhabdales bacterium]